jgi:hypothetical protein
MPCRPSEQRRLRAVPEPSPEQEAAAVREAWLIAAEAFDRAVEVPGLSAEDRAAFVRRRANCRACAGLAPVDPAPGEAA